MRKLHRFSLGIVALLAPLCALRCGDGRSGADTDLAIAVFGAPGSDEGQFAGPRAIGVGPDTMLYIIDRSGRVQKFDPDGTFVGSWELPESEKGTPTGIGFDLNGSLLIPDTHYSRVLVMAPDGTLLSEWGTYGGGSGEFIYPTDIVVDSDGNFYVAEYGEANRIQKFDKDHSFITSWGSFGSEPGQFKRPMALAMDSAGYLYVADSVNHRIQKFKKDGTFVLQWGTPGNAPGQFKYPYDIAIGPDDTVYVCEYGNCRVQKFAGDGTHIATWGEAGLESGRFGSPWGIAVSRSGTVFVADTENHRVQVLTAR